MTSSNRIIFRVTGHLCWEFTGDRWIPRTKASGAELWCFLWSATTLRVERLIVWGCSLCLTVLLPHWSMATKILVTIGWGNGLLPACNNPLPELVLTHHQRGGGSFGTLPPSNFNETARDGCMMTSSNGNIYWPFVRGIHRPLQKPLTRSFDVFFNLRLNKRLSKQSWGWWFETPPRPIWRHCNDIVKWWFWKIRW